MKIDKKGCTRIVIIIGKLAIKFPRITTYKLFLHGLLANLEESIWNRKNMPQEVGLPDVLFVAPFGLFSIQRKVRKVNHIGLFWVELERLIVTSEIDSGWWLNDCKPQNFGYLNGQLVKIDVA